MQRDYKLQVRKIADAESCPILSGRGNNLRDLRIVRQIHEGPVDLATGQGIRIHLEERHTDAMGNPAWILAVAPLPSPLDSVLRVLLIALSATVPLDEHEQKRIGELEARMQSGAR